jgi:hypothetical protein
LLLSQVYFSFLVSFLCYFYVCFYVFSFHVSFIDFLAFWRSWQALSSSKNSLPVLQRSNKACHRPFPEPAESDIHSCMPLM